MLITRLRLSEEISHLDLCGKIVKGNNPVMNRALCEVGIYTNVFGQLMLDRICSNLKSPSAVTVKRRGGSDRHTKILQDPTKPNHLLYCRSQSTNLSLSTRLGNCSLLLGLPDNERRPKKDTVTNDR